MNPLEVGIDDDQDFKREDSEGSNADYTELLVPGARELDVLEQLSANILKIDEIYGRLRFVLNEVKHVITKRSEG